MMTLEELETKVHQLEQQITSIQKALRPLSALPRLEETFGMFGDDAGFDDVLKLGREYREQANEESGA